MVLVSMFEIWPTQIEFAGRHNAGILDTINVMVSMVLMFQEGLIAGVR